MLTKDDLMKLSKERLAELLLEEWSKKENTLAPFEFPSFGRDDCFHGGPCTIEEIYRELFNEELPNSNPYII